MSSFQARRANALMSRYYATIRTIATKAFVPSNERVGFVYKKGPSLTRRLTLSRHESDVRWKNRIVRTSSSSSSPPPPSSTKDEDPDPEENDDSNNKNNHNIYYQDKGFLLRYPKDTWDTIGSAMAATWMFMWNGEERQALLNWVNAKPVRIIDPQIFGRFSNTLWGLTVFLGLFYDLRQLERQHPGSLFDVHEFLEGFPLAMEQFHLIEDELDQLYLAKADEIKTRQEKTKENKEEEKEEQQDEQKLSEKQKLYLKHIKEQASFAVLMALPFPFLMRQPQYQNRQEDAKQSPTEASVKEIDAKTLDFAQQLFLWNISSPSPSFQQLKQMVSPASFEMIQAEKLLKALQIYVLEQSIVFIKENSKDDNDKVFSAKEAFQKKSKNTLRKLKRRIESLEVTNPGFLLSVQAGTVPLLKDQPEELSDTKTTTNDDKDEKNKETSKQSTNGNDSKAPEEQPRVEDIGVIQIEVLYSMRMELKDDDDETDTGGKKTVHKVAVLEGWLSGTQGLQWRIVDIRRPTEFFNRL